MWSRDRLARPARPAWSKFSTLKAVHTCAVCHIVTTAQVCTAFSVENLDHAGLANCVRFWLHSRPHKCVHPLRLLPETKLSLVNQHFHYRAGITNLLFLNILAVSVLFEKFTDIWELNFFQGRDGSSCLSLKFISATFPLWFGVV